MVNKDVLFQTFMKLESYDRINIISDLLKFSNSFELEFYSSIIGSILQYQKLSFESLKEELNHDDNILYLKNTDCIDSYTRSKLISTISLLKVSNITGAAHIFEFLRKNYYKFKELARTNPNTYEEILLIYQLANDHPAFSFNHCIEIYNYLKEIKAVPVIKDYSETQLKDEYLTDLNVVSIEKNELQEYVYQIRVDWNNCECCITRTLEDIYNLYSKLYEMFTKDMKDGKICALYLSYIPDNLEFSKSLMSKFFKDFLNSPRHVLNCDFVRQFFKPRSTDKYFCDYDSCSTNYKKFFWHPDQRFENISNCSSPNNPSDTEEYNPCFDNKNEISSFSNFDFSSSSKCHANNLSLGVSINNQTGSDDSSDSSSLKPNRNKNRIFHSSGSSPINTPSDESEICHKNESSKHSSEICRQLTKEMKNDMMPLAKDLRTESWLCQSTGSISESNSLEHHHEFEDTSKLLQYQACEIGNLYNWLKQTRLHKYHSYMRNIKLGEFLQLTEDKLNDLGFVDGASKKLISLIRNLKPTDIQLVSENVIHLISRIRSNSNDSSRSIYGSVVLEPSPHKLMVVSPQFLLMVPSGIVSNPTMFSIAPDKQSMNPPNINS